MKKEVKRKAPPKKRKVRKSFIFIMLMFIFSILVILCTTVLFPINNVKIEYSGKKYTEKDIRAVADVNVGENMIMLSKTGLEKRITTRLAYIGSVDLKKKFPDTVIITPKETKADICIKDGKEYYIFDKNYKLLGTAKKANKKLTCINGLKLNKYKIGKTASFKSDEVFQHTKTIQKALAKTKLKINYIDLKNNSDVTVYLDKRFKIRLGTFNDLKEKLDFTVKMLDGINKKNAKDEGTLNLTYFSDKKEGYFAREEVKVEYFK